MTGESLAAIIVGVGGLITAIGIQVRGAMGDKFQRKVDQAAALLSGYTDMVANLRQELKECQESALKAVQAAQDHARRNRETSQALFDREREEWRKDRAELKAEIARQDERIDDLTSQVLMLRKLPPSNSSGA